MVGWVFIHFSSYHIAPNFWKKPTSIKNYILQRGNVTLSFPDDIGIIGGHYLDNENKVRKGTVSQKRNFIKFSNVDYGHFAIEFIFHNQSQTNKTKFGIFHQPNWSRDRYEIISLRPLEYKLYSDGEFMGTFSEDGYAEDEKIKIEPVK